VIHVYVAVHVASADREQQSLAMGDDERPMGLGLGMHPSQVVDPKLAAGRGAEFSAGALVSSNSTITTAEAAEQSAVPMLSTVFHPTVSKFSILHYLYLSRAHTAAPIVLSAAALQLLCNCSAALQLLHLQQRSHYDDTSSALMQ
jgi:hypothetical protein